MAEAKKDAATSEKTEVANTVGTSISTQFLEGAGEGTGDFSQSDFTVPFIGVLQALSKPLQKGHAKYIKSAEQGMFLNSATQKTYSGDDGFIFVPVFFHHRYLEWAPNNGGIVNDWGNDPTFHDSIEVNDKYQRITPAGNEIVDAMEYFGLIVDLDTKTFEAAVLPFSKVFTKRAKKFNNLIRAHVEINNGKPVKPAIYFYAYKITTVPESNDKGSWYAHQIEDFAKVPEWGEFGGQVFQAAKELRMSVASGELKAAVEEPTNTDQGDGEGAF